MVDKIMGIREIFAFVSNSLDLNNKRFYELFHALFYYVYPILPNAQANARPHRYIKQLLF